MSSIKIDDLAREVMKGLDEYADVTTEQVKRAVRKAGNTVRKEIQENAPKNTGDYAKSWTTKKVRESSHTLELVVHSKNRYQSSHTLELVVHSKNRYQLTHLLEFGHCLRNGGRTRAVPHIAPAEEKGIEQLEKMIERDIRNG